MNTLSYSNAELDDEIAWRQENTEITTASSAIAVFTEFEDFTPLIMDATISIVEAKRLMQKSPAHVEFVVDENNYVLGVVSVGDFNAMVLSNTGSGGHEGAEFSVVDCIKLKFRIKTFNYSALENTSINDVIEAFKESGHRHCMVIDRAQNKLRGVISANEVAKKLKIPVNKLNISRFI